MSKWIIQLIVVVASVLLGMFIYPWLRKKFKQFIDDTYNRMNPKPNEIKQEIIPEIPSVIGKSKFKIGHSRTKAATDSESDKREENAPIFASDSTDGDPEIKDVYVPLEKEEEVSQSPPNSEDEVDIECEDGAVQASGVYYDELVNTKQTIQKDAPDDDEKSEAGRVLYEQESTEILGQIISNDEKTLAKVNELIHFHVKKYNSGKDEGKTNNKVDVSNDFNNFDINSIF